MLARRPEVPAPSVFHHAKFSSAYETENPRRRRVGCSLLFVDRGYRVFLLQEGVIKTGGCNNEGKETCHGNCFQTSVPQTQCRRTQCIKPCDTGILANPSSRRGASVQAGTRHGDTQHLSVLLVGCGILMYSLGDKAKNAPAEIIHIEGDPDHPVNRGTLCPKGAGLLDFVHSPNRLKYPEYRAPARTSLFASPGTTPSTGSRRLMKNDRDKNFIARTPTARQSTDGSARVSSRPRPRATKPVTSRTRSSAASGYWHSIISTRLTRPTVASLAPTFGRGAMTNHWVDIKNANLILIMGGNAAEAHPCGFKWVTKPRRTTRPG